MAGTRQDPYPDLTTRWRWTHGMGHVQLSGFAGWAWFDLAAGSPDDASRHESMRALVRDLQVVARALAA